MEYLEKLLNSGLISSNLYWFLVAYLIYFFLSNIWRSRTQSRMFVIPMSLDDNGEIRTAIIDLNDPLGINLMRLYHNEYKGTYVRTITNSWLGRPYCAIVDPVPVTDTLYETPALYLQNHPAGVTVDLVTIRPRRNVWRRLIRTENLIIETNDSELFIREVVYTRGPFITVSLDASLYFTRSYVV